MTSRSKFGLVVDKCEEMCRLVSSLGQDKDIEAQDLMARLTLDIILQAGFGMRASYMSDLQSVPLLQELHYAMDESFRYLTKPCHALECSGRKTRQQRSETQQSHVSLESEASRQINLKRQQKYWLRSAHPWQMSGCESGSEKMQSCELLHIEV